MNKEYCDKLAKILICPKTKTPLVYDDTLKAFVNKEHNIIYKIEDGIPVLLDAGNEIPSDKESEEE